jgi:hypothetical protein
MADASTRMMKAVKTTLRSARNWFVTRNLPDMTHTLVTGIRDEPLFLVRVPRFLTVLTKRRDEIDIATVMRTGNLSQ